ncbi:MAG TPA: hypothetical protein VEH57_00315 [Thermoplasmata archaeon]|nr:hypothetical protein [Thermoplasmata archaeon]
MNEGNGAETGRVGWNVRLGCGHLVWVPWDSNPAAALAGLLHHDLGCRASTAEPFWTERWPAPSSIALSRGGL